MELWNLHLSNSEVIKIKSKKKDLLKSEKKFLTAIMVENEIEKEVLINRNLIVMLTKEEKKKKDLEDKLATK